MKTITLIIVLVLIGLAIHETAARVEMRAVWEPELKTCRICGQPLGTVDDAPFLIYHARDGRTFYTHVPHARRSTPQPPIPD